mmetsp:Transcript_37430/g.49314  ORF Transcript_37430/g.49314 Transcript_37430/m.49314 type:complete len:423 (-) Transcript_37430:215-1483(-)
MTSRILLLYFGLLLGIGYFPPIQYSMIVGAEEVVKDVTQEKETILVQEEIVEIEQEINTANGSFSSTSINEEETVTKISEEIDSSSKISTQEDVQTSEANKSEVEIKDTIKKDEITGETVQTTNMNTDTINQNTQTAEIHAIENVDVKKEIHNVNTHSETIHSIKMDSKPSKMNPTFPSLDKQKHTFATTSTSEQNAESLQSFPQSEVFISSEIPEEVKDSVMKVTKTKSNPFMKAINRYNKVLEKHYHIASFIQASVLGILGDVLAQFIEGRHLAKTDYKGEWFNGRRTLDMSVLCMVIDGYVTPLYYDSLELISTKRTLPIVLLKTFIGSAIWGPLSNGVFLAGVPFMRHGINIPSHFNLSVWKQQLKIATIRDFQIWPLLDAISFRFLPKHWRPLFANLAGIGIVTLMGFFSLFPWPSS